MSVHEGHRQRVKKRFRAEGLDHFDDLHIVELLLFYCVPRQDTNLLAHRLIERFGSLHRIMEAPVDELNKVEGVGENISTFLSLIPAVNRACQMRRNQSITVINSYNDAGYILRDILSDLRNENVYMICLDAKRKVLCVEYLGEGSIHSASVPVRRVVERAIAVNASSVILGHNHPGGIALPSEDDVCTTIYVAKALRAVDIELADHVVVSDDEFVSMVQAGVFKPEVDGGYIR